MTARCGRLGSLPFFLFLLVNRNHHARARAVAIHRAAFASRFPCLHIESVHQSLVHVVGQVDGHADAVVNPFLYGTLHPHFHQPIHIVGRCLVIRRPGDQSVNLLLRVTLVGVNAVHPHPFDELAVVNDIFLKRVAHLIHKVDVYVGVVGIHLSAAFIHRHEHRLYAACGLCHQTCGACRCYGQAGNVSSAVGNHVVIQLRIGLFQSVDEWVVLFPAGVKCPTLFGHFH